MIVSDTQTYAYENLNQELAPSSEPLPLPQPQQEVPLKGREPTFSPFGKQKSTLSLTLDEIQCKSGRSFGSMNMDEFLASIWSSDDNQVSSLVPTHDEATHQSKSVAREPIISQQTETPFSVPPPICKKTLDEVWSEIHKSQPWPNEADNLGSNRNQTLKKQQTLGEITLEDFLIKAGVVQESSLPFKSLPQPRTALPPFQNQTGKIANNRPLDAASSSYGFGPAMGVGFSTQQNVGTCDPSNGLATYQMFSHKNNLLVRDHITSRDVEKCQSLPESSGSSSRKRTIEGPPEMGVERRQRRMLKNRESAARSRARRQAYTVELEAELTQLKEENEKLKQILAEAEQKRKQERKHQMEAQKRTEKFRAIRRTTSAAW